MGNKQLEFSEAYKISGIEYNIAIVTSIKRR